MNGVEGEVQQTIGEYDKDIRIENGFFPVYLFYKSAILGSYVMSLFDKSPRAGHYRNLEESTNIIRYLSLSVLDIPPQDIGIFLREELLYESVCP